MESLMIAADLHNHSTASDGELRPAAVVEEAAARGLTAVALTDHDTLAGLDEALAAGPQASIDVIPGVELTLRLKRPEFVGSLHLLLYFTKELFADRNFRKEMEELFAAGRGPALVRDRTAAINRQFGPKAAHPLLQRELQAEEIESFGRNITRRHFARALSENHGLDKARIDAIIGNRSPAYLPSGIDPEHFIPIRKQYPLLVFLAHPAAGSYPPPSHYREVLPPWPLVESLLPEFLAPENIALDGLEIEYPGHLEEHKKALRTLAHDRKLLISGGSDGHDLKDRPYGVCGLGQEDFSRFNKAFSELV